MANKEEERNTTKKKEEKVVEVVVLANKFENSIKKKMEDPSYYLAFSYGFLVS